MTCLVEEQLDIDAIFFCMSEDNLRTILRQSWVMLGSDAAVRDTVGPLARDMPHPRAFGTCARMLAMVRDEKLMPLEAGSQQNDEHAGRAHGL